jgi:hypothetical protein
MVFLNGSKSVQVFNCCLYMHCQWRSSYQEGRVEIPFTGLTCTHLCTCSKPGPGFPMSYVVVFFRVQWVKVRGDNSLCWYWWNCWPSLFNLSCFVDIGGIVYHHCLNFLLFCWYWWNCWPSLFKLSFVVLILMELLTITV